MLLRGLQQSPLLAGAFSTSWKATVLAAAAAATTTSDSRHGDIMVVQRWWVFLSGHITHTRVCSWYNPSIMVQSGSCRKPVPNWKPPLDWLHTSCLGWTVTGPSRFMCD